MPRPFFTLLPLLAACLGCDAGKLNDLAKQAARRAAESGVVAGEPTPASSLAGVTDTFEEITDTLAAMQDESSARANVGRFKRLVQEMRGQLEQIKDPALLRDEAVQRQLNADRERRESIARRFAAEVARISRSPDIGSVMAQAYQDLDLDESAWDFLDPAAPPRPLTGIADSRSPLFSAPETSPAPATVDSYERGGPPLHPKHQEIRDRIERMREEAEARRPRLAKPEPLAGPDVLTIRIENVPDDAFQTLIKDCAAVTSSSGYQAEKTGRQFLFRVRHTADVRAVSEKITFAAVTAIDEPSRTISLKY
jgi:hypothetical protein